jgi:hypothetical protein
MLVISITIMQLLFIIIKKYVYNYVVITKVWCNERKVDDSSFNDRQLK